MQPLKGAKQAKATAIKQLKPPPGNGQVSDNDAEFITPPKGSAPKSTINNLHGSEATPKSTTENHHEFTSIEAKGAKAKSNDLSKNDAGVTTASNDNNYGSMSNQREVLCGR